MPQKAGCAGNTDGQKWTNEQTKVHQVTMRIYLPVEFELDWTKHFRARVRK